VRQHARDFATHFATQGSPIMIGTSAAMPPPQCRRPPADRRVVGTRRWRRAGIHDARHRLEREHGRRAVPDPRPALHWCREHQDHQIQGLVWLEGKRLVLARCLLQLLYAAAAKLYLSAPTRSCFSVEASGRPIWSRCKSLHTQRRRGRPAAPRELSTREQHQRYRRCWCWCCSKKECVREEDVLR